MLLYKRYIIQKTLLPLVTAIFAVTGIVWITQILRLLTLFEKDLSLLDFFYVVIMIIPNLLFILLPLLTPIAIVHTYNNLSDKRQLLILQNAGLSNFNIALPGLIIAIIVTIFSYYIASYLLPISYRQLESNIALIKENYVCSILRENSFNKIGKNIILYVDKKLPNNAMKGLVLFDDRNPQSQVIFFAKYGSLQMNDNSPLLELKEGVRQSFDKNGNITKLGFDSLLITLLNNKNNLERDNSNRDVNEYFISELLNSNTALDQVIAAKLKAAGHQRLIWPFYNFMFTFLALSIFLKQPYNRKSQFKALIYSVGAILIFMYSHLGLQNLASKNSDFIIVCYLNLFVVAIFSIYLYSRKTL